MAQLEWTSFFALLVCDFLKAGAGANDIPALEVLPMVAQDSSATQPRPCLVMTCEAGENGHPRLFEGTVTATLKIQTKLDGEEPATAAAWMGAVDARMRDDAAWSTWAAALSEERRAGWVIIHRKIMPGTQEADMDSHTQERKLHVVIRARVLRSV